MDGLLENRMKTTNFDIYVNLLSYIIDLWEIVYHDRLRKKSNGRLRDRTFL